MATTSRKREKIKKDFKPKIELPELPVEEVKAPENREILEADHIKNLEVFG